MRSPRSARHGVTVIQLIALLALFMILLGLLLPAIQKVRAAAARAKSINNLKLLGLALHNYNDTTGKLPPGVDNKHFSATARLLPYFEQDALYRKIDFTKSIDDPANAAARATRVQWLESPRDPVGEAVPGRGPTSYLFNDKVFYLNSAVSIQQINAADGTSNTISLGETLKGDGQKNAVTVQRQYVLLSKDRLKGLKEDAGVDFFKNNRNIAGDRGSSWMDGRFLQGTFNGRLRLNDPRPDVSCAGAGGVSTLRSLDDSVLVGVCDGSVRTLSARRLSLKTFQYALDPAAGQVLGPDW
jgi:hypothetical protein